MIQINKAPYICSLTKNSIEFAVSTDMQYDSAVVYPNLELNFIAKPVIGTNFRISFTNPESGAVTIIHLVAVDGSSASNYTQLWQIPDTSFPGSLADLRTIVYQKLKETPIINALFNIDLPIIEFEGSVKKFTITAKEAIEELVMNFTSDQPSADEDKYIREANSVAYHQPGVRDGYALKASLYVETNYNSGAFNLVTALDCILNAESIAYVDVAKYIDSEIESNWNEYPVPFEQELGYIAPNLRRYYVVFSETFANDENAYETKSEILYAHWGGASSDDFYNGDPIAAQNTSGKWLTWWPSGKRILKEQSDWLGWMNGAEEVNFNVICTLTTNLGTKTKIVHENVNLQAFETYVFNTGYDANNLDAELEAGEIVGNWSFSLGFECIGCDKISITYTLVGAEPITIEVNWLGDLFNGKKKYLFTIGSTSCQLTWTPSGGTAWYFNYPLANSRAYFLSSNDCPFGTYTIFGGGLAIFESFEVVSAFNCNLSNGNSPSYFTYYPEKSCLTKQIVFFNSFGIHESFILSSEFQQNITTSQELATRTESYALNNLLPQNYIFDSKNVISYKAETMMLSNLEAERLMPLVNSTISFLLENGNFIPVIINAGTTAIYKVNSFLQKIQLDLVRSNESDRVSYFDASADFEPIITDGISVCTFKRNGLNITDFGSIKCYFEGIEIGEFNWNSTTKIYSISSPITQEGLLTFKLTYEVNSIEKTVSKQLNFAWKQLIFEKIVFVEDGTALFQMQGISASKPFRIDWSDGTTEDETLTNSLSSYSKSYADTGKKTIRIFKPWFGDVVTFKLFNAINHFDYSSFTNLQEINLTSCVAGNYYFTGLKQLRTITFDLTVLHTLNIGYQKYIEGIYLYNTSISQDAFDAFLKELWLFRKAYENEFVVWITSEVILSNFANSIISGTGIYAGDGLNTYGITVQYD